MGNRTELSGLLIGLGAEQRLSTTVEREGSQRKLKIIVQSKG